MLGEFSSTLKGVSDAIFVKNLQTDQKRRKSWTFLAVKNVISIVVKSVESKIFLMILFASKQNISASLNQTVKATNAFSAAKKIVRVCGAANRKIANTTFARIAFQRKK